MAPIKQNRTIIKKKRFQLIGENKEKSKDINLKSKTEHDLHILSRIAKQDGIERINSWTHIGTKKNILSSTNTIAKEAHLKFIEYLKQNPNKNKQVLVVGPAKGYETEFIKENIPNSKIDTFDIVDEISKEYLKHINNKIVYDKGIENYHNKEMIGKYDGITAVLSAGMWSNYPERNIVKMALMLKPKGIATITTWRINKKKLIKMFEKLELLNHFELIGLQSKTEQKLSITSKEYDLLTIVIKRK